MSKTQLVIMAAGMGSRFGGLKQITPVDIHGQNIIDYSIFDAMRAGFDEIILIIKPDIEAQFKETIGQRIGSKAPLRYVYQELDHLPAGFQVPEGRIKPWGTAHAVLCAADVIDSPFTVINADDFYGPAAFRMIHDALLHPQQDNEYVMVGYQIENTLTENGTVSRGVCQTNNDSYLTGITERTTIEPRPGGAAFTEDGGKTYSFLPAGTIVSMNFWGFQPDVLPEFENRFVTFLQNNLPVNPLKCEYYLPSIPNQLIAEGKKQVRVLPTQDKWYGMTYKEDCELVRNAIAGMIKENIYPDGLWK